MHTQFCQEAMRMCKEMGWDETKDSGTEPWMSDRALEKEVPDEISITQRSQQDPAGEMKDTSTKRRMITRSNSNWTPTWL